MSSVEVGIDIQDISFNLPSLVLDTARELNMNPRDLITMSIGQLGNLLEEDPQVRSARATVVEQLNLLFSFS